LAYFTILTLPFIEYGTKRNSKRKCLSWCTIWGKSWVIPQKPHRYRHCISMRTNAAILWVRFWHECKSLLQIQLRVNSVGSTR
jgi:hypothetical protein